ncbi:MAG TPA: 23S rRNA (adenine(2503)-C(2))-methyltransferase RlmN [Spirochaetota bacterium]|nr:23S rRNA (adenine(2503)-C(2))-methyltransferase RlmN [Spirochaetota bacterium]
MSIYLYSDKFSKIKSKLTLSKSYVNNQLWNWLYKKKISAFTEITNISKSDLHILQDQSRLFSLHTVKEVISSASTVKKIKFRTADNLFIETVIIPDKTGKTATLCISSQIGCSLNCRFCATGRMKFQRNLYVNEIIEQYLLAAKQSTLPVKNIVFMGMGEPLLNLNNVLTALNIFCDKEGFGISAGRITVSTAGIIGGLRKLNNFHHQANIMISLHSAGQKLRDKLMPCLRQNKIKVLKKFLHDKVTPKKKQIMLEYIMIKGYNDTNVALHKLLSFCRGLKVKVNFIAYNKIRGLSYQPSDHKTIKKFITCLKRNKITASQRYKKGDDIAAACGQLIT